MLALEVLVYSENCPRNTPKLELCEGLFGHHMIHKLAKRITSYKCVLSLELTRHCEISQHSVFYQVIKCVQDQERMESPTADISIGMEALRLGIIDKR